MRSYHTVISEKLGFNDWFLLKFWTIWITVFNFISVYLYCCAYRALYCLWGEQKSKFRWYTSCPWNCQLFRVKLKVSLHFLMMVRKQFWFMPDFLLLWKEIPIINAKGWMTFMQDHETHGYGLGISPSCPMENVRNQSHIQRLPYK